MASDWKEVRLGEIVDFTPKRTIKKGVIAPFISMADVTENSKFITEVFEKEYTGGGSRFTNGDTLFARITPCLQNGKCSKVSGMQKTEIGHGSTEFIIMAAKMPEYDEDYIYYLARLPEFRAYAESRMIGSTGRQRVSWQDLEEYKFSAPPSNERKDIGSFLSSLDDKIELNRQMNETLEAIMQALFKSWFVDFDPVIDNALAAGNAIPDEFFERAEQRKNIDKKDSSDIQDLFSDEFEFTEEMGWIPKGWSVGTVKDVVKRLKSKKSYNKKDVLEHGEVPVYEQGAKILLGYHNNEPDIEAQINEPAFIFGDHTCINKLSLEPFSISSNVIPLIGKIYPTLWVYYAVKDKQSFEEYRRHWMEFIIKPVILPSLEVTELFSKYIKSFQVKQMKIQHQNSELAKLRDTLLPKLMSGELRIADAAVLVDEAL